MRVFRFFSAVMLLVSVSVQAELQAGQPFPALTMEDQFGKVHSVGAQDKLVILAFDMDASEPLKAFLEQQDKGFLEQHKARYIADISAMPSLISKFFAVPKMQDYPFTMLLNRDEAFKAGFAEQEGKLTVYRLQAGVVEGVSFIDGAAASTLFE